MSLYTFLRVEPGGSAMGIQIIPNYHVDARESESESESAPESIEEMDGNPSFL
jgi:hypothetical protein